ncbi:STAS domain-containing protein [Paenibacillus sp. Z3-2]
MFTYELAIQNTNAIVICKGDIDIDASDLFEDDIQPALRGCTVICFDFTEVYFVDSSGIGLIIKLVNDLQESGVTVRIEKIRPEVVEVFELLQIDEILGKETFA